MIEAITYKFKRRIHLLNLIKGPYLPSEELITLGAIADLGRACESFLERLSTPAGSTRAEDGRRLK